MMTKKEMKRTATDTEREMIRVEKYRLNEKTAIQKKIKGCKEQPLTIRWKEATI